MTFLDSLLGNEVNELLKIIHFFFLTKVFAGREFQLSFRWT